MGNGCTRKSAVATIRILFAFTAMTWPAASIGAEAPGIQQVIDALKRSENTFFADSQSVCLKYGRVESTDLIPSKNSGKLMLTDWTSIRNRANQWFFEQDISAPYVDDDGVRVKPKPRIHTTKSDLYLDWHHGAQNCTIRPKTVPTNVAQGWDYARNIGLNPYRYLVESTGWNYDQAKKKAKTDLLWNFLDEPLLPDLLVENRQEYKVKQTPEIIDGRPCWLVEWPGMDAFWVDPELGLAIRRRVTHWGVGQPLQRDVTNRDFKEVKPGLWLPFEQTVLQYAKIRWEDSPLWGKMTNRSFYKVKSIEFDGEFDAHFEIRLPQGTVVRDFARNLKYTVVEPNTDPYSASIADARRVLLSQPSRRGWWLLWGNAALLLLIGYMLLRKRRRQVAAILLIAALQPDQAKAFDGTLEERDEARSSREIPGDSTYSGEPTSVHSSSTQWLWKPSWRSQADCGPNALFVLLKLLDRNVSLDEVRARIPVDPLIGCSISDLHDAGNALRLSNEVRFVTPKNLPRLPFPYILHGKSSITSPTGHFLVVVGRNPKTGSYGTVDPMQGNFGWQAEGAILSSYSGYVLIPTERGFLSHPEIIGSCIWILMIFGCFFVIVTRPYHARVVRAQSQRS
jgi:hypothetical protein